MLPEILGRQDRREPRDQLGLPEIQVLHVPLVLQGPMVPSDRQVLLAIQAHRGNQGRRENPDHRVNKDRRVKQELHRS